MDGDHDALGGIGGDDQVVEGEGGIGAVALHGNPTVGGVLAASGTYGIHAYLRPRVEALGLSATVGGVGAPAPATIVDLVHGLEDEEVSFVGKLSGYLSPHLTETLLDGFVLGVRSGVYLEPIAAVGTIVVYVDNGVEPSLLGIAHHFGHALELVGVDGVGCGGAQGFGGYLAEPGYGDAYGAEASGFEGIEGGLCARGVAPGGLASHTVVVSIELVAEVPAHAEFLDYVVGRLGGLVSVERG